MSKKHRNIFSFDLVKKEDTLEHKLRATKRIYESFIKELPSGQEVTILVEAHDGSGRAAQISKIHACIREIALSMGEDAPVIKNMVKERACLRYQISEDKWREISFAHCSLEELILVIQEILKIGDVIGINFRDQLKPPTMIGQGSMIALKKARPKE